MTSTNDQAPLTEAQELFLTVYAEELREEVRTKPDQYAWPSEDVDRVAAKMVQAFIRGSANKDSNAVRRTCRRLGVAYTYAGIRRALGVV